MGTSSSTENNQDPAQQLNLDHLTTNQYHQTVIRNLYATNQHSLTHPGAFIINEAGEPVVRNIKIKKTRPIEIQFQIDKSSVKLTPISGQPKNYTLSFTFTSKVDCKITVYLLASETVTDGCLTQEITSANLSIPPETFFFEKGDKQKFADEYIIRTAPYQTNQLCEHTDTYYPLMITIEPKSPAEGIKQKIFASLVFTFAEGGSYNVKLVRQKLQFPHKAYMLDDIYGNETDTGAAANNDADSKNCIVCLEGKIDTICLPCRHMCLCYGCAKEFKKRLDHRCPMCRRTVKSFLKYVEGSKQKWLSELDK